MVGIWLDLGIVVLLLIVGGLFTATEMGLVTLRAGQLRRIAGQGKRGARVARLVAQPERYLAAVQIGSIVAGFFAAAFATATLAEPLAGQFVAWGMESDASAYSLAVITVTLIVTVLALVISELTPRRYAMQHGAGVAMLFGPTLDRLATLFRPLIWLLSNATNLVLRLLRSDPTTFREQMSSEELREMVASHEALSDEERRIVRDVFAAGGLSVRDAMLPRTDVDFLDASLSVAEARGRVWQHAHTRYSVIAGNPDTVVGFVHARDLLNPAIIDRPITVRELVRPVLVLPATKPLLSALTEMQHTPAQLALVVDEYGGLAGIVTLEDVLEEIVGDIYDEHDRDHGQDGAGHGADLFDGLLRLDEFTEATGIELPAGPYDTVGGWLVNRLGRMPEVGDTVTESGHRFSVDEIRGWRVQRLRVTTVEGDPTA